MRDSSGVGGPVTRAKFIKPSTVLFLMAVPGMLHFIIFRYIPMLGNIIVFQDYNIFRGIWNSPWVGFKHFSRMFTYVEFYRILRNTLVISLYSVVFGFPAPLVLTLFLNEVNSLTFKRSVQTIIYLPYFLSWVIIGGIFLRLLSVNGIVNQLILSLGAEPIPFLYESQYFRPMLVGVGIWRGIGWGTIIYLASITAISPTLYEAATVDGAGRLRKAWSITLPCLMPTIVTLFLLRIGNVLDSNVEQVLIFLNPLVRDVGEVIDTYIYRAGLLGGRFSYTTAIGIFKATVGISLVVSLNALSNRLTGHGIY